MRLFNHFVFLFYLGIHFLVGSSKKDHASDLYFFKVQRR